MFLFAALYSRVKLLSKLFKHSSLVLFDDLKKLQVVVVNSGLFLF